MAAFDFESLITDIPDHPEPGVVFKDITTLLKDPDGFAAVVDALADHFAGRGVTKVVGAEARGFMIGAPVAYRLHAGFVPARKPGKLPRETFSQSYDLEYGADSLPSEIRFRQAYTLSFYLSVMGRVSPVPNHTFHTYRFLYTERFFRAAFQFLHTFHGFRPYTQGSTSLCSPIRDLFSDTAEFTLCYGLHNCSPLLPRLLYPLA